MALKIIGKVHTIGQTQTIASKNGGQPFTKREIIIDATRFDGLTGERGIENYPAFEFGGERCAELDKFKSGDIVEVYFDLQGSFYEKDGAKKNMTRVRGYKIDHFQTKRAQPASHPAPQAVPQQPPMPSDYPPPPPSNELPW